MPPRPADASRATRTAARRTGPPSLAATGARERILAAADDLFYRRGVRAVGIDEIIAAAGVAKASLYNHFESKDALIGECLRLRHDRWIGAFAAELAQRAADPRGRLLGVFLMLEEWLASDGFRGCAFQNAAVELADRGHAGHAVAVEHKRAMRAHLQALAAEAGVRDPRGLGDQLALLAEGAIVTAVIEGSPAGAAAARRAAATLIDAA